MSRKFLAIMMLGFMLVSVSVTAAQGTKAETSPFPAPSGPYKVGTVLRQWTDSTRDEPFTPDTSDKRELLVQLWYPADSQASGAFAPYMSASDQTLTVFEALINGSHDLQLALPHDKFAAYLSHAYADAALATDQPSYPVLVFSPGFTATPSMYTVQLEELASQGYIIAAINYTYGSAVTAFPDGRTVMINPQFNASSNFPVWVQDQVFVINQLEALNASDPDKRFIGKLDLKHLGLFGHSLGGGVALKVGLLDSRVSAILSEDSPPLGSRIDKSLPQAVMLMESEHNLGANDAAYQQAKGAIYHLAMGGFEHDNFADFSLWPGIAPLKTVSSLGEVDPVRSFKIVNTYALAFFDKYLKGKPETLLDGPSPDFKEVTIQSQNK
ncbi:MAG: hypothetical protein ABI947_06290 [Chloroflexota bacterium]